VKLRRQHRERKHYRSEKGDAQLREEEFLRGCVDQIDAALAAHSELVRDEQEIKDVLREHVAENEESKDGDDAIDEPPPKLDQMLEERRLGLFDVLVGVCHSHGF